LACACLVHATGATAELRTRHHGVMRAAIMRYVSGADVAEIEQQLLGELLVGSAETAPKIGRYSGQAPLGRWLQVTAQRTALMWLRSGRAEARARGGAAAEPLGAQVHPEIAYLKERYR